MLDFDVFIDLTCVRVGTLQTCDDFSYRDCDFVNDKTHSYVKNYSVPDFIDVDVKVGKTYRFFIASLNENGIDTIVSIGEEV
jgi:hypothetical protein